jgi:hypothetical protein
VVTTGLLVVGTSLVEKVWTVKEFKDELNKDVGRTSVLEDVSNVSELITVVEIVVFGDDIIRAEVEWTFWNIELVVTAVDEWMIEAAEDAVLEEGNLEEDVA